MLAGDRPSLVGAGSSMALWMPLAAAQAGPCRCEVCPPLATAGTRGACRRLGLELTPGSAPGLMCDSRRPGAGTRALSGIGGFGRWSQTEGPAIPGVALAHSASRGVRSLRGQALRVMERIIYWSTYHRPGAQGSPWPAGSGQLTPLSCRFGCIYCDSNKAEQATSLQ